jgi:hypothetical protein
MLDSRIAFIRRQMEYCKAFPQCKETNFKILMVKNIEKKTYETKTVQSCRENSCVPKKDGRRLLYPTFKFSSSWCHLR